jgi:antitoxin component YwqK of YwqJK toxin-antitoxin module
MHSLCAQTDSLVTHDTLHISDSAHSKNSVVRFSIRNHGGQVNGLNVSMGRYDVWRKTPALYRVNGFDLALLVDEQRINGMGLALLWLYADTLNGFGCGLLGGTTEKGNGLFLYGLAGLSWTSMNGISAAGLWQINTKGNGVTVSGISTVYDESYNGLLLSGVYNRAHEKFRGFGMAGAVQFFGDAKGFVASGAVTVVDENFSGFLFSGVSNTIGEEAHGLLIAAVNTAPVMQGVQIGIVNYTNRLQGVQFGLINVNRTNPKWCRVLPFINFNFRPLHETDTIYKKENDLYVLRSYNRNGRLASVSQYQNGKLEGVFTLYNSFNDKVRETNYHAGLKEGEEFFFDGEERITESSFYHADTLAWSSTYDYPDNTFSMFVEKTIYYGPGKEMIFGLMGTDTIYKYTSGNGYHVERDYEEFGAGIYKVYHRDSLLDIIWLKEKWKAIDFNGPSPEKIVHIRPNAIPAGGIVLSVDPLEYGWSVHSAAKMLEDPFYSAYGYYFPLTVNAVNERGRIVYQLRIPGKYPTTDSILSMVYWPLPQEFRLFDKKGNVKLQMDSASITTFYTSGKIQNQFNAKFDMNEGGAFIYSAPSRRIDYYESGDTAFYSSRDTVCIWDTKGRLKQFEHNDTVRTYYENGSLEYEVTSRTLKYFNSKGELRLSGKGDTLYTFHNGQPDEMIMVFYDSIAITNSANGALKYNGITRNYFHHNGKWIYQTISKEPLPGTSTSREEGDQYNSHWFGATIIQQTEGVESFWFDKKPPSPVPTPKWLDEYFWPNL